MEISRIIAFGRVAAAARKHCLRLVAMASVAAICPTAATAQVGEHRSELAIGVNGGYTLSNVGFVPDIPQGLLGGYTGGLTVRYTYLAE